MIEKNLFTYVKIIKEGSGSPELVDCQAETFSDTENGTIVSRHCATCYFSDGVVLRYDIEQEEIEYQAGVCPECWIAYRVIETPEGLTVSPGYKSFTNQCQESFWLKMNLLQSGENLSSVPER